MEQHEYIELHDRWQHMINRMAVLFNAINARIDLPDDQVLTFSSVRPSPNLVITSPPTRLDGLN